MRSQEKAPATLHQLLFAALIVLALLPSAAHAVDVPPAALPTYLQTSGPTATIGTGDWYTNTANGVGAGYHYFDFSIPCGWPATDPVYIDLFSPEIVVDALGDEVRPSGGGELLVNANNTIFELYRPGTVVSTDRTQPFIPAPGGPNSIRSVTYLPKATGENWVRFHTLAAPVACGTYLLRAETLANDDNAWRLRVGYDNDADPNNAPPANSDNRDGLPGTNDEIVVGVIQASYQHNVAAASVDRCLTLYEFVQPNQTQVVFHNFDLDSTGTAAYRVRYYPPSATFDPLANTGGVVGTPSPASAWNNSVAPTSPVVRTGDTIANPEPGWWRIVSCVTPNNQYVQEAQFRQTSYYSQPPIPVMTVAKDDGVTETGPGATLTYTIDYANTANTVHGPNAGAATNVVIRDSIPTNTSYVGCSIPAPIGTCAFAAGVVTFSFANAVNAGVAGSVSVTVQVNAGASGTVTNNVTLDYRDSLGNNYPQVSDTDTDTIPTLPVMTVTKDDGIAITRPGTNQTYTIGFANVASGPNAGVATSVQLADTLPTNTTYVSCAITAPFTGTCSQAAGVVSFTINGNVAPGVSGSVTVSVSVNAGATGTVENTVTLTYNDDRGNPRPPVSATDIDQIPGNPAMDLSKTDGVSVTTPGETLNYTITFTNTSTGPTAGPAVDVVLRDTFPTNTTYLACAITAPFTGTCAQAGGVVTFTLNEDVNPGASGTVTVRVQVNADAVLSVVNTVTIDYTDSGGTPQPRLSASDTDQLPPPDLRLLKAADRPTVQPGQPIVYTLNYFNDSVIGATGVIIDEAVPIGTSFVAAGSTPGWSCTDGAPAETICSLSLGSLAGNASGVATFVVRVNNPVPVGVTQIENTASIRDDGSRGRDPTPPNNITRTSSPPTPITLEHFTISATPDGLEIEWSTGVEIGTAGFHLYRSTTGARADAVRVTEAPLVARGQPTAGADYRWLDKAADSGRTTTYWLREIERGGGGAEYGPFVYTPPGLSESSVIYLPLLQR